MAGKAGILLSAISADRESLLSTERVDALAAAANINTIFELPNLLGALTQRGLIDATASGVAVLGVTSATTLDRTAELFDSIGPTSEELAAIDLAEVASRSPVGLSEISEQIADRFFLSDKQVLKTLSDSEDIGFVDVERLDSDKIYFNGNLFRRENTVKVKKILDSLSVGERRSLTDVVDQLQRIGCMDSAEVAKITGAPLFNKVMSVGFFDLNIVSNSSEETGFITLPSAFSKYSSSLVEDAFDLAKAFVSSITYGITKSNDARGRIAMVQKLLAALVRGEAIGPVSAIAEDYRILELKGVVKVAIGSKRSFNGNLRTGPMMTLLKKEVGELAMQVLNSGDISEHSLDAFPSAAVTHYRAPEENQQRARKRQVLIDPAGTNDILRVLRSGGF